MNLLSRLPLASRTRHSPSLGGLPGLALAAALVAAACYTGPGADYYVAVLDELETPSTWVRVQTRVRGPDQAESCDPFLSTGCPAAIRAFVVEGDVHAALAHARDVVTRAGFLIEDGPTTVCSSISSNGPRCSLFAERGDDRLLVAMYSSPYHVDLEVDVPIATGVVVVHASSN